MNGWLLAVLILAGIAVVYTAAAWIAAGIFFNKIAWRSRMKKGLPFQAKGSEAEWAAYGRHMKACLAAAKQVPFTECHITAKDGVSLYGRLYAPAGAQAAGEPASAAQTPAEGAKAISDSGPAGEPTMEAQTPAEGAKTVSDSGPLAGAEAAGKPVRILLGCHGYGSRGDVEYSQTLPYWQKRGFYLLAPDLRAHGRSGGDFVGYGVPDCDDFARWIDFLVQRFGSDCRIVLMGSSMGGGCAMMMADRTDIPNVAGIISDCGYPNVYEAWRDVFHRIYRVPAFPLMNFVNLRFRQKLGFAANEKSALAGVQNSALPVLLLHGTRDSFVDFRFARRVAAVDPDRITLVPFEGAEHVMSYFADPARYEAALDAFLHRLGLDADPA